VGLLLLLSTACIVFLLVAFEDISRDKVCAIEILIRCFCSVRIRHRVIIPLTAHGICRGGHKKNRQQ
jgi:hypothetical protein